MTENNANIDQLSSTSEDQSKSDRPSVTRADSRRVIDLAKEFEIKAKVVSEDGPVSPKQKKKTVGLGTKIKHVFQFWKKQDEITKKSLPESRSQENLSSSGDLTSPRELSSEGTPPPSPVAAAKLARTRSSTVGQGDQPSANKAELPADLRTSSSPKVKRKRGISEGKPKNKKDQHKHAHDSKLEDGKATGDQLSPSHQSKPRKQRVASMRVQSTNNNTAEAIAQEHQRATSVSSRLELHLDQLQTSQADPALHANLSPKNNVNTDRSSKSRGNETSPPTSPKSVDHSPGVESVLTSESSDEDDDEKSIEKESEGGSVVKWIKKKRKKLKQKMKSQKSLERLGQAALRIVSPRKDHKSSTSNPSSPRKVVAASEVAVNTTAQNPADVFTTAAANAVASAQSVPLVAPAVEDKPVDGTSTVSAAQPSEVKHEGHSSDVDNVLDDSSESTEPPAMKMELVEPINKRAEVPPVTLPATQSLENVTADSEAELSARSNSVPSNPTTPRAASGKFRPPLVTKVSQKFLFSSKLDTWLSARTGQNEFLSKKILKKKIFSDSLDTLCAGGRKTPLFVDECIDQLQKVASQDDFQLSFSYRHPIPLDVVEFNKQSIEAGVKHVKDIRDPKIVTSLLLTFLTELAGDSVLCDKFYYFIEAQGIEDPEQRRITVHSLIYSLPILHRQLLKKILIFLDHLVSKAFNLKRAKEEPSTPKNKENIDTEHKAVEDSSTSTDVELTKEDIDAATAAWNKRETEELLLYFGAALAKRHSLLSTRNEVVKPINSLSPVPSLNDLPGATPRVETGRTADEKVAEETPKEIVGEKKEEEKKESKKEDGEEKKEASDSPKAEARREKKNKALKNKEAQKEKEKEKKQEKEKEKEKNKQAPKLRKDSIENKSSDSLVDVQNKSGSRSKIRKRSSFKDTISSTPPGTPPTISTLASLENSGEASPSPRRTLEKRMSWTGTAAQKMEESESDKSLDTSSSVLNKTPEKNASIPEGNEDGELSPKGTKTATQSDSALVQNVLRMSASAIGNSAVKPLNASDENLSMAKSPATRAKNKTKKTSPSKVEAVTAAPAEVIDKDSLVEPIAREKCVLNLAQGDAELDKKVINLMKVLITERKFIFSKSFPDIVYQMKEGHLIIQSSKIDNLVAKLLDTNYNDRDFIDLFLIAYYYFIEPQDLLDKLVAVFHKMNGTDLKQWQLNNRIRILQLLKMWVKTQREEFQKKPTFVDKFKQFIRSTTRDTFKTKEEGAIVSQFLNDMFLPATLNQIKANFMQKEQQKKIEASKKSKIDIFVIDAQKIASTLSTIDHRLFKAITPRECLNKSFVDPVNGVNFVKMTVRFNTLGRWVQSQVLNCPNAKQRAQAIAHFLDIAAACIEEHNFNTALAIFTAMNAVSISRLKGTWVKVHKKSIKILEQIDELFSMRFNYKNYRDALAQSPLPVVPYIGLFTKFLFAIEETNMSILPGDMINFEKLRMLYTIVKEIKKYQGHDYVHQAEPDLEMFLEKLENTMSEEELYKISLKIEPQKK